MPHRDDILKAALTRAGIAPSVIGPALEIDTVLQAWRRRMTQRELGARAIADLGLDIDLADLDVLIAIRAPANEFGAREGETMVATVATRLGIDPSRASRLVADLIRSGHAVRAVSQSDARRTIVELTPRGAALVERVRRYKFLVMGEFLQGWTPQEIAEFVPLLRRFSAWTEQAGPERSESLARQIAALRDADLQADMSADMGADRGASPGADTPRTP